MNEGQSIKSALRKVLGVDDKEVLDIIVCTVNFVDTQNWTCNATPDTGNNSILNTDGTLSTAQITDIQLTGQKGSNGVIPIPAVNSQITILVTVRLQSYVLQCSDLQGWVIYVDNGAGGYTHIILGVNAPGQGAGVSIQLNDGSYGGLVEIVNLTTKLNSLVSALQGQLPLIAAGIATGGGTYTPGTLPTFTQSDYENTKIKHGV
jgi:hypothetical protein